MTVRPIVCISLRDRQRRRKDIVQELMQAATGVGFFHITDHDLPPQAIQEMLDMTKRFFACPEEEKGKLPVDANTYLGWERNKEVSPITGFPDHKESIQVSYDQRGWGQDWPTEECCPGFRATSLSFMSQCHELCLFILSCFAEGLGLPEDAFAKCLDKEAADCNSAMRSMHYYDVHGQTFPDGHMRLTPHTDITFITLLFHWPGETGLEVCPGREATTDYAVGNEWTACDPIKDAITINIGDGLMYCSDDVMKSNFHRIRAPNPGDYQGPRNTVVYFTNPNLNAVCQGPAKKYPAITGQQMAHVMELAHQDGTGLDLQQLRASTATAA